MNYREIYESAPPEHKQAMLEQALALSDKWVPNPGPQTDAYWSKADCLLFGGQPGGGKLLSLDTPIPTPHGFTTMGGLAIGDEVFDEDGNPCRVVAKSQVEFEPTYKLTFSDGSEIVAGERHEWVTSTRLERMRALTCTDEWRAKRRQSRPSRVSGKKSEAFTVSLSARNSANAKSTNPPTESVKTTGQIAATLRRGDGGLNHAIAVAGALRLPEADLLVEPYVLGAWLGDGTSSAAAITGLDEEIFEQVANSYLVTRYASQKTRGVLGLKVQLRQLGVLGNKHIPAAYLRSSYEQRVALLQGLMDTDGHCDLRGQCEIQLTRKELIDGVYELLCSLGIKVQMREGDASLNGEVVSRKWRLKFLSDIPVFRLARKLIRQKRGSFRGTHAVRYITACERVADVPLQCIQVDSKNHMYLCGRSMIPTHNSQLCLGLAFNQHRESYMMRRQYGDLERLIADALKIHGSKDGFNGQAPPRLKFDKDKVIHFEAANRVGDEQGQMGAGRDLLCLDEATHFAESQVRFLMGWVRTEVKGQRCRTVLATNPPLSAEGLWVIKMFAPWLDPQYPNPAKQGELRWVISDADGLDLWVNGPQDIRVVNGKPMRPTSRSYIQSSVSDNPYYAATDYERNLDAMPEPYRSLLMGGFKTEFRDQENQVIPTAWVSMAMKRWHQRPDPVVPLCSIGVDCSGGGRDPMVIARRWDGWFDKLVRIPGKEIPMERSGAWCAGQVLSYRRDDAEIIIDMGGGYGSALYEHLYANGIEAKSFKGAESSSRKVGKLKFPNNRSAAHWAFREALDPGQPGGSRIALPEDQDLLADLTAATFEVTPGGIRVEAKEKVCDRLGRSTDSGDAVILAWWSGKKAENAALEWAEEREQRKKKVSKTAVLGSRAPISTGRREPVTRDDGEWYH